MPRLPRLHVPNGFYHAVLRGNHREALFDAAADRQVLNDIVADVINRFGARVHAFCWMSNHLHALLQIADRPLGEIMQRIAMRYARHRHKTLRTTGHLFERRYRATLVDTDARRSLHCRANSSPPHIGRIGRSTCQPYGNSASGYASRITSASIDYVRCRVPET